MSSDKQLWTPDNISDSNGTPTTGQTIGTKRTVHFTPLGGGTPSDAELIDLVIKGYVPEPNWDQVTITEASSTQNTYNFLLNGSTQFTIEITGKDTTTPTATVVALQSLLKEDGDILLLESGDELLKEQP